MQHNLLIPQRCDWKYQKNDPERLPPQFQYLKGAIGRVARATIDELGAHHFNTSKVRLEDDRADAWKEGVADFNTSKVRLEGDCKQGLSPVGQLFQYLKGAIGSSQGRKHLPPHVLFQYLKGAIGRGRQRWRHSGHFHISIPQRCDWKDGRKIRVLMVGAHFNTSKVRLEVTRR